MKFLYITDTHFLKDYTVVTDRFLNSFLEMDPPMLQLEKLLAMVGEFDFVIHGGDMCHSGDFDDYSLLKEEFARIFGEKEVLVTCGNHDDTTVLKQVFTPEYDINKPLVYSRVFDDLLVVSFDSTKENSGDGEVTDEVCEMISDIIAGYPEHKVLLFTHHHLIASQFVINSAVVSPLFSRVLDNPNVIGVITGHTHHFYHGVMENTPYFTGDAIAFSVENTEAGLEVVQRSGLQIFEYNGDKLTYEYFGGDTIKQLGYLIRK